MRQLEDSLHSWVAVLSAAREHVKISGDTDFTSCVRVAAEHAESNVWRLTGDTSQHVPHRNTREPRESVRIRQPRFVKRRSSNGGQWVANSTSEALCARASARSVG
jgi:hypothetical protein